MAYVSGRDRPQPPKSPHTDGERRAPILGANNTQKIVLTSVDRRTALPPHPHFPPFYPIPPHFPPFHPIPPQFTPPPILPHSSHFTPFLPFYPILPHFPHSAPPPQFVVNGQSGLSPPDLCTFKALGMKRGIHECPQTRIRTIDPPNKRMGPSVGGGGGGAGWCKAGGVHEGLGGGVWRVRRAFASVQNNQNNRSSPVPL